MTLSKSYKPTSASSKPTLHQWLKQAETKLVGHSTTPRLDAHIIAERALKQNRQWLLIHDDILSKSQLKRMNTWLSMRLKDIPIAYILDEKEFYGRTFKVAGALIPRPDTEAIIEMLRLLQPMPKDKIIDVGTGSGIIAITAALEWPDTKIFATEISQPALDTAMHNAQHLKARVLFSQGNLLDTPPQPPYRFIIANLPYVDRIWNVSPETAHEPHVALFADDGGLALIKKLIVQAPAVLEPSGYLLLEADPRQHEQIRVYAKQHGFSLVRQDGFVISFQR